MRSIAIAVSAVLTASVLAGCSSPSTGEPNHPVSTTTGQQAPGAEKSAGPQTAEQVTTALIKAVPSVRTLVVYNETTDPNHAMGRPHQYVSKTAFADSRINRAEAKKDDRGRSDAIAYGGTVEVFANEADAKAWADNIDRLSQAVGGLITPDYLYRSGQYVIRASSHLIPTQARQYQAVLTKLV
ncbi:hypothetical protein [Streptomyces sp. H39-S7]|uniref:hypothetical protein n=1 Tax=Streptomyces sp. H39-S7 TaxID=3004357 RepID=UPI0022AED012|nr:hypothetical protein [Streptomyces sp. H39-S7]MCZ4118182.1 hypothetical protein [Streptomyces sp. H39-S7]